MAPSLCCSRIQMFAVALPQATPNSDLWWTKLLSDAHARTELRSCVQVEFDKARAANRSCSVRSFTDCLTEALGDKTNKEHEAGAKHFAEKITLCMRQKLTQVRARAYFELLTTVLAGHGNSEHKTEMPFDMPLMMTTSGRTL
ncbi:uncharacterized protein [Dermacentor albipictus]|uniref:uncharacterized protein isoform X4 n=1 Tax=Dermacentor albipictus TaxID=60249 RepID=UPI0038FCEFF7